jgi:hypothetical protein
VWSHRCGWDQLAVAFAVDLAAQATSADIPLVRRSLRNSEGPLVPSSPQNRCQLSLSEERRHRAQSASLVPPIAHSHMSCDFQRYLPLFSDSCPRRIESAP